MGRRPITIRTWIALVGFAAVSVVVAVGTVTPTSHTGARVPTERVAAARSALVSLPRLPQRVHDRDYDRAAFGAAWTDETDAQAAGNGCDTRNDILERDLSDKTYVALSSCGRAVAEGELRSPYTGAWIAFRRGRGSGADVQIDHIVALSYAWDMGASHWSASLRARFANDPANLVAVDGPSNQDKGDSPPSSWMPRATTFACQYAVQFVTVTATYRLSVDAASVAVLQRALRRC
ncbi:HNH endonuclease family protein [Williamsia sp. CHRR-6]|uniref:HNH endonuclease family protein n=1 Tax=Williamsia sp. CHRR-6 TaxID=2835871 RepID=UPI001BD9C691|nr:HNH endonuclease family protein [Williamsia sp. CHRR-6]MBT0565420.1 HNH endonuclease [Williamsia sp. CHRR-6]